MKPFNFIYAIILIFLSITCEDNYWYKYYIKVGETINVDRNLNFTISEVLDGRCPPRMMCLWGGDVMLRFNIKFKSTQIDTLICQSSCNNNPFKIEEYNFKILDVSPYREDYREINQGDYKIKMEIKKD